MNPYGGGNGLRSFWVGRNMKRLLHCTERVQRKAVTVILLRDLPVVVTVTNQGALYFVVFVASGRRFSINDLLVLA